MSTLIGAQSSFGLALRNTRLHLWLYSSWIVQAEIRACVIRCMLTVQLLNRSIGDLSPPAFTRDVNAQLSRQLRYNGDIRLASSGGSSEPCAHAAGVNAIAIDRFEGR